MHQRFFSHLLWNPLITQSPLLLKLVYKLSVFEKRKTYLFPYQKRRQLQKSMEIIQRYTHFIHKN